MPLYLIPVKGHILKPSSYLRRIWSSSSVLVCRHVSESFSRDDCKNFSCRPPHSTLEQQQLAVVNRYKPVKLAICRLASGKLRIVTTSHRDGYLGRNGLLPSGHLVSQECSLMLAAEEEPTEIMSYESKDIHNEPVPTLGYKSSLRDHCLKESREMSETDAEPPLLFSPDSSSYHQALDIIAAATDAGNICNTAAARLTELCHLMHVESVIRLASKPHGECTDDIIIRRENRGKQSARYDYSHFIQTGDQHEHLITEQKGPDATSGTRTSCTNHDAHSPCIHESQEQSSWTAQDTSAIDLSENGFTWCATHQSKELWCREEPQVKPEEPQADGPSKEQLAYMHLRLSEEMPKFFEKSHDYGLYAGHVHFDNRIMRVSTRGLPAYKATVQSLKYLSTAYLLKTQMEVLRITMETEQGIIQARWRIKGVPLHSYILRPWSKAHSYGYFDAFSTFHIGNDGLIHTHVLDKVIPSSETNVRSSSWAVRLGVMLGLVRPPAFNPDVMKPTTLMRSLLGK